MGALRARAAEVPVAVTFRAVEGASAAQGVITPLDLACRMEIFPSDCRVARVVGPDSSPAAQGEVPWKLVLPQH
jgi:hypothetical protein